MKLQGKEKINKMLLLMMDVTKLHRSEAGGVTCTCTMCLKTKEAGQELTYR